MKRNEILGEVSSELLGRYKKAAGKQASDADKKGDFKKGDKRFSGIVKATKKQFANDAKKNKTAEATTGKITQAGPNGTEITQADGVKITLPADKTAALTPDASNPNKMTLNTKAVAPGEQPQGPKVGAEVELPDTNEDLDAMLRIAGLK